MCGQQYELSGEEEDDGERERSCDLLVPRHPPTRIRFMPAGRRRVNEREKEIQQWFPAGFRFNEEKVYFKP